TGGVNVGITAINMLVTQAKQEVNAVIGALNMIPGVDIEMLDASSDAVGLLDNKWARRVARAVEERNELVGAALSRDYIGELGASFRSATNEADNFSAAMEKAGAAVTKVLTPEQEAERKKALAEILRLEEQNALAALDGIEKLK